MVPYSISLVPTFYYLEGPIVEVGRRGWRRLAIYLYKYYILTDLLSARPKGFFSFRLKPKLAETAIFLFGRNRYQNQKIISVLAGPKAETEMTIFVCIPIYGRRRNFLFEISFDNCSSRLQK